MVTAIVFGVVGYVAGAFTPAVGREIKALFVKESTAAKTAVNTTVAAQVEAEVKKL